MIETNMAPARIRSDATLREIVRLVVKSYAPDRVYLFGSTARGDHDADSDYDLLVVVPDDSAPDRRSAAAAYRALWAVGRAADVVIWTRTAFERRAEVRASLPATVLREGVLLHER